jgi:hypothetical protein
MRVLFHPSSSSFLLTTSLARRLCRRRLGRGHAGPLDGSRCASVIVAACNAHLCALRPSSARAFAESRAQALGALLSLHPRSRAPRSCRRAPHVCFGAQVARAQLAGHRDHGRLVSWHSVLWVDGAEAAAWPHVRRHRLGPFPPLFPPLLFAGARWCRSARTRRSTF